MAFHLKACELCVDSTDLLGKVFLQKNANFVRELSLLKDLRWHNKGPKHKVLLLHNKQCACKNRVYYDQTLFPKMVSPPPNSWQHFLLNLLIFRFYILIEEHCIS